MSTELVVRNEAVPALVEEPAVLASRAPDPVAAIEFASQCASLLKGVLLKQRLITRISGNDHVQAEGWTLLAAMTGYSPRVAWSRKVDPAIGDGWEACVELVDAYGRTVSAAEAMALKDEGAKWSRQEYSVRSMAQTRATSRAIRLKLGYIVTMAGYSATAAEEMPAESAPPAPGRGGAPPARAPRPPVTPPGRSAGTQGPATQTRAVAGPSAMEVTHPEHRLHRLWSVLDHYGIAWEPQNWNRAVEALKASGITEVSALEDHETAMRATEVIRGAFGVKPAGPQPEPYESASPLAAASFTKEVDGTLTAMYVVPSSKGDGTTYNVHLSNAGRDVCECPARKACRHLGEAETLLGQDAEQDPFVRKAFAVRLGLAEPEPPEAA